MKVGLVQDWVGVGRVICESKVGVQDWVGVGRPIARKLGLSG